MKIEVRYFSRGGNTKKLADAIASALNVTAQGVDVPMAGRADVVFLCASVYAGTADKSVTNFIKQNARDIGKIVVVSSSATGKSTHGRIRATAEDMGVQVAENFFHCPGAWALFHKGRPNAQDCQNAAAFAKSQL